VREGGGVEVRGIMDQSYTLNPVETRPKAYRYH
jgi:hypothetical protein